MTTPPRPPVPAARARLGAALLESSFLLAVGAMFVSGLIEGGESDDARLPMRLGPRALPLLAVVGAYATLRLTRPHPRAFLVAGALTASLGAVFAPGQTPSQRVGHGALGLVVGAIVTGWSLPLDREGNRLLAATTWTGRELFFVFWLVTFGTMPSVVAGGFLITMPAEVIALLIIGQSLRLDFTQLRVGPGRVGAAARLLVGLFFGQMALSSLIISPLMSSGLFRPH